MFSFLKKQKKGATVSLQIVDMHCTSCALTIDDALEELPGVYESNTQYARAQTVVQIDPEQISIDALRKRIAELGYQTA